MLAAYLKSSCPKWHGFCPPPDGSISQDSERANWNILLAHLFKSANASKLGGDSESNRFTQPQGIRVITFWWAPGRLEEAASVTYILGTSNTRRKRREDLFFCWTVWNEHVKEVWWKNPIPVLLPQHTPSQCNHADFDSLVSWYYLDAFTWMKHGISSTFLPLQLAYQCGRLIILEGWMVEHTGCLLLSAPTSSFFFQSQPQHIGTKS